MTNVGDVHSSNLYSQLSEILLAIYVASLVAS